MRACATKKHAPSCVGTKKTVWSWSGKKRMITSAAIAKRRRNGPMAIAVHRRAAYGARPAAYLQQDYKNPPMAPVYTNIHKIHLTPFDTKFTIRNPLFYKDLFGNQNVYTYIHKYEEYFTNNIRGSK